ncbi:hypothetical protein JTB14_019007 [Gonioctena quinquepunctata]|nr:hypothetical protein JTB14_019007 [Gonioctena quinquepunctata]
MDSTILKRDFEMFGKMHQYITEYANKTLLKESSRMKEIEDKTKLISTQYQELRRDFVTMKRSDKDDFAQLIGEFEGSSISEHLMYLTFKKAEAKGPDSIENSELLNVIRKRHRDKMQRLKYTLKAIRDVIKENVKEDYGDKYPNVDMEEVILEQMEILDPELYEKYISNLRKNHELKEAKRMEKEKANDSKLKGKEAEKREAPGKTQSTGASAPPPQEDIEKAQSLKERKANPEETGKNKSTDITPPPPAQTPPKNAAAKAPLEKSPLQIAFEEDQKEFKVKEAEHKRELEFYRQRKELHKLQSKKSKESAVDEYFEHLSESAMEERNEQRKSKERRNTLSPDDNSLEDEYFNYLASSDDETTPEDHFFSDGGTYMGQTITPRYTREEIRPLKDQKKENIEIKNQERKKNVEEEIPHIFPNATVLNEPMDTQDVVDSPVSEDINDKIPITKKGKKNKKKEDLIHYPYVHITCNSIPVTRLTKFLVINLNQL